MEKRDVVVYSEDYKKLVDAAALKDKYYEIDERVEEICKEAFKGCDKLEEIVMPKKLKKIDSEAFQGCSSLTKLTLPDSVARIDGLAFCGCSGLTDELAVNALNDDFEGLRLRKSDAFGSGELNGMRKSDVESHLVARKSDFVTYAVDDEALFKPFGYANHHVVDESAVKSVQCAMVFVVGVTSANHVSVLDFDVDGFVNRLGKCAEGAFHRNEVVVDINCNTLRNGNRCSTDS